MVTAALTPGWPSASMVIERSAVKSGGCSARSGERSSARAGEVHPLPAAEVSRNDTRIGVAERMRNTVGGR